MGKTGIEHLSNAEMGDEFIRSDAEDDHVDGVQVKLTKTQKKILNDVCSRRCEAVITFVRRAVIARMSCLEEIEVFEETLRSVICGAFAKR